MAVSILGTGSYLPKRIVTNAELAQKFSTTDAWIREKTGIEERRYAAAGEGVSDMAALASRKALSQAHLMPTDLDAIVFATATPEYHAPGSGILLQNKLGCRPVPAFDIRNTSPGFIYSLDLACGLIASGRYQIILVVGSEVHSTMLDFTDRGRMMSVIFGDGCGCMILGQSVGTNGLLDFALFADGTYFNKLWCEGPSSLQNPRISKELIESGHFYPSMDGRIVFENAVKCMSEAVQALLTRHQISIHDIDFFISHQANLRIVETIGKMLGISSEKCPHNIEKYGNTSSASIPILFDELNTAGKIKPGMKIVMMSFGSGFCWGAALLET